jgi:CheY-like chemotaxis protein
MCLTPHGSASDVRAQGVAAISRVLVVDDDPSVCAFIALALGDAGCRVMAVPDGAAALAAITVFQPTLIMLDLYMPVMDGWAFARVYRERPGPHALIVIFTAAQDAASHAEQLGAQAYLPKPFDLDDLFAVIDRFALVADA